MIDSASAEKYWYFMRLMGRDPSHLVLQFNIILTLGFRMCFINQTKHHDH